jgi:integrase
VAGKVVTVPYLKFRGRNNDLPYFEPTKQMRDVGFRNTRLRGTDAQILAAAETIFGRWQAVKLGQASSAAESLIPGSIASAVRDYIGTLDKKTGLYSFDPSDDFEDLGDRTRKDYRYYLDCFVETFGEFQMSSLGSKILKKYYKTSKKEKSHYVAYHRLLTIRAFLSWAVSEELIKHNPASNVKVTKPESRTQRWEPEQVDAFEVAALKKNRPSMQLAVRIADWVAQRPFDIRTLKRSNYNGTHFIAITQSKGKTKIPPLPLPKDLIDLLDESLLDHNSEYLIVSEGTGEHYSEVNFQHIFAEIRSAAGVPDDLQFRDFRRTAITDAFDAGATDEQARALSGHANSAAMEPYRVLTDTQSQVTKDKRLKLRESRKQQAAAEAAI